MWPGLYGDLGSRKYLTASLDSSLSRLGVDDVDIFYHHRPDPETPLEETMGALDSTVRAGKARDVGVSSYSPERTAKAAGILRELCTPLLSTSPPTRCSTGGSSSPVRGAGIGRASAASPSPPWPRGCSPTANWMVCPPTPALRRASHSPPRSNDANLARIRALNEIAPSDARPWPVALAWVLRDSRVTSTLIGASSVRQPEDNVASAASLTSPPTSWPRSTATPSSRGWTSGQRPERGRAKRSADRRRR